MQALRSARSAVRLAVIAMSLAPLPAGALPPIVLDDGFDDGDVATNANGTGTGFASFTQLGASVGESAGVAILDTGTIFSAAISQIASVDTFDFFGETGATIRWELAGSSFGTNGENRRYLSVVREDCGGGPTCQRNPADIDAPAVFIRLADVDFEGFTGALIVEDGTGSLDVLESWDWTDVWDGSSLLQVVLFIDDFGYLLRVTGNLGALLRSGGWGDLTEATGFTGAWDAGSADVGVLNQGLLGFGTLEVDRIVVSLPEPAAVLLQIVALGALGSIYLRRDRRGREES